jgi:hypothetical protein
MSGFLLPSAAVQLRPPLRRRQCLQHYGMTSHAEFFTAGLGWVWLGVTETWTTLAASPCALVGATIMVGGAVAAGHLFGDLLALGSMTTCIAVKMLIIRPTPILPAAN